MKTENHGRKILLQQDFVSLPELKPANLKAAYFPAGRENQIRNNLSINSPPASKGDSF